MTNMTDVRGSVGGVVALVAGIGVAILVLIFVGSLGGQTYQLVEPDLNEIGDGGISVSNELVTLLLPADGGTQLTYGDIQTVYNVTNSSHAILVDTTDYTINLDTGALTLVNATYNNTLANVTYTAANQTVRDSIKNSIVSGFSALEDTGNYLPIIVLAIVISLVLVMVLGAASFTGVGPGRGGSAL